MLNPSTWNCIPASIPSLKRPIKSANSTLQPNQKRCKIQHHEGKQYNTAATRIKTGKSQTTRHSENRLFIWSLEFNKTTSSKMGSTSRFQLHNFFWLNPDLVVGVEVAFILVVQAISKGRGHLVHHLSFIGVKVPEGRLAGEAPRETAMISLKRDLPFSNQNWTKEFGS